MGLAEDLDQTIPYIVPYYVIPVDLRSSFAVSNASAIPTANSRTHSRLWTWQLFQYELWCLPTLRKRFYKPGRGRGHEL